MRNLHKPTEKRKHMWRLLCHTGERIRQTTLDTTGTGKTVGYVLRSKEDRSVVVGETGIKIIGSINVVKSTD